MPTVLVLLLQVEHFFMSKRRIASNNPKKGQCQGFQAKREVTQTKEACG
jgi:hypothetical protein